MKRGVIALTIGLLIALQSEALTLHRSFCTREVGVGFGTGKATVAYPIDARAAKVIAEARADEAKKIKVIIGRCTRVSDGDTIHVVTSGNMKYMVRLELIDAPGSDQPFGEESAAYLSSLVRGRTVRVEWQRKDRYGCVVGIVYLGKTNVNLKMVATGHARHFVNFDRIPAYAAAESAAKERRLGLWGENSQ